MRLHTFSVVVIVVLATRPTVAVEPDRALDQLRVEVIAALTKFDPDPKNKDAAEKELRAELAKIIEKHSENLRPAKGSKKHVSGDKAFILVIAANGQNGGGEKAEADDADAKLVLAVGGNGCHAVIGQPAGGGGFARANAKSGVALALGGAGGNGARKVSGGGGGGAGEATGGVGSIRLGGNGGGIPGLIVGGQGRCKIENAEAIVKSMKELKKNE